MRSSVKRTISLFLLSAFLLGSHKGYLALWKEDRAEPYQIFPVKVDSLPQEDQESLARGIPARSDLELAGLLEDFLS